MSGAVAILLIWMWRSRVSYSLKAASLATGALLITPYLFLYDVRVLAIAVAFLVRLGLDEGFARHELPALVLVAVLLMIYPYLGGADRIWRNPGRRSPDRMPGGARGGGLSTRGCP